VDKKILVAISDFELQRSVCGALHDKLKSVVTDPTWDQREAKKRIAGNVKYHLLVAHVHLTANGKAPLRSEEQRGLSLTRWAVRTGLSCILISPPCSDTELDSSVLELPKTILIKMGLKFHSDIVKAADNLLRGIESSNSDNRLIVTLSLDPINNQSTYELRGEGSNFYSRQPVAGPLVVEDKLLEKLGRQSRSIDTAGQDIDNDWYVQLRDVGQDLIKNIFRGNLNFWESFKYGLGISGGGIERTKICFRIKKDHHSVAWEALSTEDEQGFWMLKAPIYRSLSYSQPLTQFQATFGNNQSKMNCLIIQSDSEGVPALSSNAESLRRLSYIGPECSFLERYLKSRREKFNIGRVLKIVHRRSSSVSFKEQVIETLKSEEWHIIHYAGHSLYRRAEGRGLLFFPTHMSGGVLGQPEAMDVAEFCAYFRSPRLLYFSSCESSEESFVSALEKSNVPAAVCFRWQVDDEKASQYTQSFYQQLFSKQRQSLEDAFLSARVEMHKKYPRDRIWAAPVLVMQ
jgi:hypothetical protein